MLFALFPLWWLLGLADMIWILMAPPMVLLMVRARAIQVPRGFGIYLLFLLWALCSGVQLERMGEALGFAYRLSGPSGVGSRCGRFCSIGADPHSRAGPLGRHALWPTRPTHP